MAKRQCLSVSEIENLGCPKRLVNGQGYGIAISKWICELVQADFSARK
jgi:hypothetical protein